MTEHPQWISVKDRLPDEDGLFLIYKLGKPWTPSISTCQYNSKPGGSHRWTHLHWSSTITHWMPLPKAPEGISNDESNL